MKAEDVKVGMVLYDKCEGRYVRILRKHKGNDKTEFVGTILAQESERYFTPSECWYIVFSPQLRPLNKRERGGRP